MRDPGVCPDQETLERYLQGGLTRPDRLRVIEHLGGCSTCRGRVERLQDLTAAYHDEITVTRQLLAAEGSGTRAGGRDPQEETATGTSYERGLLGASDNPDALGSLGDFDIISLLGRGGMGVVYAAVDRKLQRPVAVKFLGEKPAAQPLFRELFIQEARAAAAINHPNVVTIHAVDQQGKTPFLVMELIPGRTLREYLKDSGALPTEAVCYLGAQIALGLAAAHDQGIVHRDIKPGNIMLKGDEDETVKITDFGLACLDVSAADLPQSGSQSRPAGTPAYMSPEQARGEVVDFRSDLFSLGCVLYAMICGRSPFHGSSVFHSANRVLEHEPPPPHEMTRGCSHELSTIVMRLMEKDPARRIDSAAEAARELTELVQGDVTPRPLRPPWPREKRLAGWATVTLLLAAVAIGLIVPPRSAQPQPTETVIRVGSDNADYSTLQEALLNVKPGGTIHVQGDMVLRRPLILNNRATQQGLTLDFHGATLRASAATAIEINNVPNVKIRGLTVRLSRTQYGLQTKRDVSGLQVEDVQIRQSADAKQAVVLIDGGSQGAPTAPITLRRCNITCGDIGLILLSDAERPIKHFVFEDSRVRAEGRGHGVCVILDGAIDGATIRRCRLSAGLLGISLKAAKPKTLQNVRIENNTFFDLTNWIGLFDTPLPDSNKVLFRRNLILNCDSIMSLPPVLISEYAAWFEENLWEQLADASLSEIAGSIPEVPLRSEDPNHPEFLRPTQPVAAGANQPE